MSLRWPKEGEPLPTDRDLPETDGKPMENEVHPEQARKYLIDPLRRHFAREKVAAFVGGNSFVYYQLGKRGVGPDVYVVLGGNYREPMQRSWVTWQEGNLLPHIIIELVSPTTESVDRGKKFVLYRDVFKTRDYFLFDTDSGRLEGFHLIKGMYVPISPDGEGRLACTAARLSLGVVEGWLRWFGPGGELVRTDAELAQLALRQVEDERRRVEDERRRADAAEAELDRLRRLLEER